MRYLSIRYLMLSVGVPLLSPLLVLFAERACSVCSALFLSQRVEQCIFNGEEINLNTQGRGRQKRNLSGGALLSVSSIYIANLSTFIYFR